MHNFRFWATKDLKNDHFSNFFLRVTFMIEEKEKIVVPVLGESITEATVSKWLKKSGEKVNADEPIVELETDKVNLEVPSPINGILSKIITK